MQRDDENGRLTTKNTAAATATEVSTQWTKELGTMETQTAYPW